MKDLGKKRIVKKFLFFPTEINHEVRWLEFATIEQKIDFIVEFMYEGYTWTNYKWIDDEK